MSAEEEDTFEGAPRLEPTDDEVVRDYQDILQRSGVGIEL